MTKTVTHVFVRNLELLARIGVHGHEHGKPQPIRINVWLTCKVSPEGDKLDNVVDYEAVADNIRAIVAAGHINLAESLAERIAALCLERPQVISARVRVEKLDVYADAASVGVEIERRRG